MILTAQAHPLTLSSLHSLSLTPAVNYVTKLGSVINSAHSNRPFSYITNDNLVQTRAFTCTYDTSGQCYRIPRVTFCSYFGIRVVSNSFFFSQFVLACESVQI